MIPNRIILDTNVCLDLFIFRDARWHPLYQALREGRLEAVSRADCREEWRIVLGYSQFRLDASRQEQARQEFDTMIACLDMPTLPPALPLCKDTDDQKFLEIARDAQAACLITKDKLLLKLARKTRRLGLFDIVSPQAWVARAKSTAAASDEVAIPS